MADPDDPQPPPPPPPPATAEDPGRRRAGKRSPLDRPPETGAWGKFGWVNPFCWLLLLALAALYLLFWR